MRNLCLHDFFTYELNIRAKALGSAWACPCAAVGITVLFSSAPGYKRLHQVTIQIHKLCLT